jgi:hypothetical protein
MSENTFTDSRRKWALFMYGVGFTFGLLVAVGTIWPDIEGFVFDTSLRMQGQVPIRCPAFLTPADGTGTVKITIANPSNERSVRVPVRTRITDGYVSIAREVSNTVPLGPGEKQVLTYEISQSDVAYGRFILVNVIAFRSGPFAGGQGTCGVWWLDIPWIKGSHLLTLLLLISLGSLGYSNYVVQRYGGFSPYQIKLGQFLLAMTSLILLAIIAGLLGWWVIGIGSLLLIVIILAMFGLLIEYFGHTQ